MLGQIRGNVPADFRPVEDTFAANFDNPGEDAAALAVFHHGVQVVDL